MSKGNEKTPGRALKVGRLAMRQEGDNWNAYYAMPDTMEDALPLGSIRMGAIIGNDARREEFLNLMRDVLADFIEAETGVRPVWGGPEGAPEHERAGSA